MEQNNEKGASKEGELEIVTCYLIYKQSENFIARKIEYLICITESSKCKVIYSRLSRSFTARGVTSRDPPSGIRLISF